MLLVLVMHTMLSFTLRPDFFATKLWFILEPLVAISHTCVLLFFMLSGYLILSKDRSIPEILNKTASRLLIPLVVFELVNIVYAYWRSSTHLPTLESFIFDLINRLITYLSSPLWFLVVLIHLYLITPLLSKVFFAAGDKTVAKYITLLAFVVSIVSTPLFYLAGKTGVALTNFTSWTVFICFYFYGALVKNKWITFQNMKINYFLLTAGVILTMAGDYRGMSARIALSNFGIPLYTQGYTSLPTVMSSIGLFNLLMTYNFSPLKQRPWGKYFLKGIEILATLSYGIYLIHTYVVSLFSDIIQFDFDHISMNVYVYNLVNFVLVLTISAIITAIIKMTPKLRVIIGEQP